MKNPTLTLLIGVLSLLLQSCATPETQAPSTDSAQIPTKTKSPKQYKTDGDDLIKTAFPNVLSGHNNPITEIEDWEYYGHRH